MVINVNQQVLQIEDPTLAHLVYAQCGEPARGIAVAVNDQVIPRNQWSGYRLSEHDSVLIIKATQGG